MASIVIQKAPAISRERKDDMAKRTRKAVERLPVEAVDARKGEGIRGGAPKGKNSSKGSKQKFLEYEMKDVTVCDVNWS